MVLVLERHDGFVDTGGVIIYYQTIGQGHPLMLLHGGPGADHTDFLPHLLPLARRYKLVLIDERGSGRSQRLSDPAGYTVDAMVGDIEAVRTALGLEKITLLGHSFGGLLAQAYAIAHESALRSLILVGTASSAARWAADFAQIKGSLSPDLRAEIEELELRGIFLPNDAQSPEYRKLADKAELPYMYTNRPPAWDVPSPAIAWDVMREMWVRRSDFQIDGNLRGFNFTDGLRRLRMPTLIILGDHELVSYTTALETHHAISGSNLRQIAHSGHMCFVDQTPIFLDILLSFLDPLER